MTSLETPPDCLVENTKAFVLVCVSILYLSLSLLIDIYSTTLLYYCVFVRLMRGMLLPRGLAFRGPKR